MLDYSSIVSFSPKSESIKIYGVGFDEENNSCFNKYLLEQIKVQFPSMEISNQILPDAKVLFINVTTNLTFSIFENNQPNDDCFTILIVHEISRVTLSLLKFADYIIYINDIQKYVCEESIGLNYPSSILPYPFGDKIQVSENQNNCLIYFEGDDFLQKESYYEERIQLVLKWHAYAKIEKHYCLFEVPAAKQNQFAAFKHKMEKSNSRFHLLNIKDLTIDEIYKLIGSCFCGQLFKDEITLEQYIDSLEKKQPWILQDNLSESPILSILQHIEFITSPSLCKSFYNYNLKNTGTWTDWRNELEAVFRDRVNELMIAKKENRTSILVDSLSDLNIVWGHPLSNDYVFSVCFRNQEMKIIRCLESIINQAGDYDIGIVIISDASTDNSVSILLDFIKNQKTDICFVDNKERKFVSRNVYNVAHSLITNDETVIIEVDGDDFLAGNYVIETLDTYYQNGALKTNGSYSVFPEDDVYASQASLEWHHTNYDITRPWSYQHCSSWVPMRSVKRHLFCQVELDYHLERKSKKWLSEGHDSAINPKLIELAKDKAVFVKEVLYCYDRTGENHDITGHSLDEDIYKSYKKMDTYYHLVDLS